MILHDRPLTFSRTYQVTQSQLWSAITVHAEMLKWYFDNIPDFKAEVGFVTKFPVEAPSQVFVHNWEVTEVVSESLIRYEWTFDDIPGRGSTTWQVSAEGVGSRLVLTDEIHEPYPKGIPEFERESAVGGWTYFLDERLGPYLKSK